MDDKGNKDSELPGLLSFDPKDLNIYILASPMKKKKKKKAL